MAQKSTLITERRYCTDEVNYQRALKTLTAFIKRKLDLEDKTERCKQQSLRQ